MKTAFPSLACLILLLALVFSGSRCSKEYSFEGSRQPTAVVITPPVVSVPALYTLAGNPGECPNADVRGTYTAGSDLSSSQTVIIAVNVATAGDFSITTDTVNGMSFSQAGKFTGAGTQTITLQGKGQPNEAGLFTFTPQVNGSKCSFDVAVQSAQPQATYVLESGSGTAQATCIGSLAGTYKAGQPLNAANKISMSVYVAATGNYTVLTKRVNGIFFSYTGTFTSTGSQYITLTGNGTPLASGTYSLTPQIIGQHPLGGEACAVSVTVL